MKGEIALEEAIGKVLETLEKRPEKNILNIWDDLEAGKRPRFSPLTIGRQVEPGEEGPGEEKTPQEKLAREIINILKPLKWENPVAPVLTMGTDEGTGFMAAGFGVKISSDPKYAGGVEKHLSMKEVERMEVPSPEKDVRFKKIKEKIDFYLEYTPDDFKLGLPDMQGPFNIANAVIGTEIFFLMNDSPEKVHLLMSMVTEYYIRCYRLFQKWIPEDRWVNFIGVTKRISECSVNLISEDLYREFVAPYDRKLVEFWGGEVAIHPCSGPHVFRVTLEELPGVRYTECGVIPNACSGYVRVEEAIERIKGKSIILSVGEELVLGKEEETIKNHFSLLSRHPLMIFQYTGMTWKREDDEFIKNLHLKLDEYYYRI